MIDVWVSVPSFIHHWMFLLTAYIFAEQIEYVIMDLINMRFTY